MVKQEVDRMIDYQAWLYLLEIERNRIDLELYDCFIVAYSGGKDSTACVLSLLDRGVPPGKIELWHHLVDGREGSTLMDWPVTEDYCRQFAAALQIPIFFSWKHGGFEREMLRHEQPTAPTSFETPGGKIITIGGKGKPGTRMKFPQISPDLKVRWCSAYLKIDPCSAAIRNQERFKGKKTLLISGERAQESTARAKYKTFEPDRADNRNGKNRRHVDRWRPVHGWKEGKVWEIIEKHRIVPHPAYYLGWGRLSCMSCIFGSKNMFASLDHINRHHFYNLVNYERQLGFTMKREGPLREFAGKGKIFGTLDKNMATQALSRLYVGEIKTDAWQLPAGAFGENAGPS